MELKKITGTNTDPLLLPFKGGLFFAKPMRENNYISMMSPFQRKYGKKLTALLAIIPVINELLWIPGLLISLGTNTQTNIHSLTFMLIFLVPLFLHPELFVFDSDPGSTIRVVLDLSFAVCVWISAAVAIIYTVLGGLYSVAYTDVIQISLVFIGMVSFARWNLKMVRFGCDLDLQFPLFAVAVRPFCSAK